MEHPISGNNIFPLQVFSDKSCSTSKAVFGRIFLLLCGILKVHSVTSVEFRPRNPLKIAFYSAHSIRHMKGIPNKAFLLEFVE